MAGFNGSGTFVRTHDWTTDDANNIDIQADRMDAEADGFATGLSTCITKDGQTTITADIPFASNKITGLGDATANTDAVNAGQVQDGEFIWGGTGGGTADVITISPSPVITAYAAGQRFRFIASGANTTNVTLNVNGVGAKAVTKNGATALVAGDIISGSVVTVVYDGTQFQIRSFTTELSDDTTPVLGGNLDLGGFSMNGAEFTADLTLSGDISPAELTGDVNNYAPTGFATASTLRLSSDAERTITGIAGGADGRIIILRNVGSNSIVLGDEDANSTAANRFQFPDASDRSVRADEAVIIQYDATLTRWVLLSRPENAASTTTRGSVEQATDAEVKAETADKFPDSSQIVLHEGVAKGWVNFNGTGTLAVNDSYNVNSVTDNGTGDYTVNWETDFANTTYAWGGGGRESGDAASPLGVAARSASAKTAGTLQVLTMNGASATLVDAEEVNVISWGDQ